MDKKHKDQIKSGVITLLFVAATSAVTYYFTVKEESKPETYITSNNSDSSSQIIQVANNKDSGIIENIARDKNVTNNYYDHPLSVKVDQENSGKVDKSKKAKAIPNSDNKIVVTGDNNDVATDNAVIDKSINTYLGLKQRILSPQRLNDLLPLIPAHVKHINCLCLTQDKESLTVVKQIESFLSLHGIGCTIINFMDIGCFDDIKYNYGDGTSFAVYVCPQSNANNSN